MPESPDEAATDAQAELTQLRAELERARASLEAADRALDASKVRAKALDAELQHRVRNILAVVRSVFSRTVENAETLEHASDHFRGRLDTLARYQLRAGSSTGFDLEEIIHDTLMTYAVLDHPRVEVEGPEVRLNGRTAESVGLALHELVTNAIKFGMLSSSSERGALSVRWETREDRLSLEWTETGIAILATAPLRIGFGREYIEQGMPYQLGGETSFELSAGRLRCTFDIPFRDQLSFDGTERSTASGVNGR